MEGKTIAKVVLKDAEGISDAEVVLMSEEVVSHALETIIEEEHVAPKVEKVNDTGIPLNLVSNNVLDSSNSCMMRMSLKLTPPQSVNSPE